MVTSIHFAAGHAFTGNVKTAFAGGGVVINRTRPQGTWTELLPSVAVMALITMAYLLTLLRACLVTTKQTGDGTGFTHKF